MLDTRPLLLESDFPPIKRGSVQTLQVNLGYKCNLSCTHCHVNAGPTRTEMMARETIDNLVEFMDVHSVQTLDLTGGAPELNEHFKELVSLARERDIHVIDRCNLTVLLEPGQEEMAAFLAEHQVEIVASLPCYSRENVDAQRGKGVFGDSITALKLLNGLGYGQGDTRRKLTLVYNPTGPFLPPSQVDLERDYKNRLKEDFEITFDQLFTITNMPISRFGSVLLSKGQYDDYMTLLRDAYSADNLQSVMCRSLISIDWQGYVYDCDFNQMLDLPIAYREGQGSLISSDRSKTHIKTLVDQALEGRPIVVGDHCYGCTAGQGSSCGGALD